MKNCPTTLKILKELDESERVDNLFNPFGCPKKKKEVGKALRELKQALKK